MKNPKDYKKPVALSMGILNVLYLIISLVVYKYCGSESCLKTQRDTNSPCASLDRKSRIGLCRTFDQKDHIWYRHSRTVDQLDCQPTRESSIQFVSKADRG